MWVSSAIVRFRLRTPWLLAAALVALATAAAAQPLEGGAQSTDGRHYLVDNGALRVISKEFTGGPSLKGVDAVHFAAKGWSSSVLVTTAKGLARVDTSAPKLEPKLVLEGEEVKVEAWGDSFLAYSEKASEVTIAGAAGEQKLSLTSPLKSVMVIDQTLALILTEKGLFALKAGAGDSPSTLVPFPVPFPLSDLEFALGGGRAMGYSLKSPDVVDLIKRERFKLDEPPVYGLRALDDGSLVAGGSKALLLIKPGDVVQTLARPTKISAELFAGWKMVNTGRELQVMTEAEGRPQIFHYRLVRSGTPTDTLAEGKVRQILLPSPDRSGSALLFVETSGEEDKIDEDGRQVFDLDTGKPMKLTVNGHRIYQLDSSGHWRQVADEPRAALVGPIERVGGRAIYATQTEPPHNVGQKLELDARYPYPAVIVHGRSFSASGEEWTYTKPRGETPSKGRLPETAWPVLEPDKGPLLITSEAGSLLALDPETGKLMWATPELAIDESSPPMYRWSDGFGLVATKSTGRKLLMIDTKTGDVLNTVTLNDVFFHEKWRHLLGVMIVCAALAYYIYVAGKRNLYIRQIAGLKALDEAVGRATEMGKPVLYVVGLADVDDIQTLASLSILGHVAKKTAEYDTPIITTTARAVVFAAAQEIVRDAFSIAGRPDAFSIESVRYISDDQFGYTAGVDGIMVREEPAANFYMGNFYAESLILAETGHATGAIQIAGTAQPNQLPFFVAACDYTLIGEELFAASAYLSRDPMQVGSLRGQDVGKMIVMMLLVVCSLLVSFGVDWTTLSKLTGVALP